MTFEELKAFDKEHPEYAELFPVIMKGLDEICKDEFGKAFKASSERLKAHVEEVAAEHSLPEDEAKTIYETIQAFTKKVDADINTQIRNQLANLKQ